MTTTPDDQSPGESFQDDAVQEDPYQDKDDDKPGVELGMTDGEGSTFEPEEDPEGSSGS